MAWALSTMDDLHQLGEHLQHPPEHDDYFDVLSTLLFHAREKFRQIIDTILFRETVGAGLRSLLAHGNGRIELTNSSDPAALQALNEKLSKHNSWGFNDNMHNDFLLARPRVTTNHEFREATPSETIVSNEQWEVPLDNIDDIRSALAREEKIDLSAPGGRSTGLEYLNTFLVDAFPTDHDIELRDSRQALSKALTRFRNNNFRRKNTRTNAQNVGNTIHQNLSNTEVVIPGPGSGINETKCLVPAHRSTRSCPRECSWHDEGENELANAIAVVQRLGIQIPAISEARSKNPTLSREILSKMKTCHILMSLGVLTIATSLAAALWRSVAMNDFSGGFSLAQYILGVGILVVGTAVALHAKRCACWLS